MVGTGAVTVTKLPDLQTWGGPRQAPEISYEETPKRGTCGRPPQGPLEHPLISVITLGWMNGWTPSLIKMRECIWKLSNFCVYMSTFVVIIDQWLVYLAIPSTHVWSKDIIHLLFDILMLICKYLSKLPMTNLPFMRLLALFSPISSSIRAPRCTWRAYNNHLIHYDSGFCSTQILYISSHTHQKMLKFGGAIILTQISVFTKFQWFLMYSRGDIHKIPIRLNPGQAKSWIRVWY